MTKGCVDETDAQASQPTRPPTPEIMEEAEHPQGSLDRPHCAADDRSRRHLLGRCTRAWPTAPMAHERAEVTHQAEDASDRWRIR